MVFSAFNVTPHKNEKNIKNVLTKVFRCGIIIKRTEMCGCGGTGRRARFRF